MEEIYQIHYQVNFTFNHYLITVLTNIIILLSLKFSKSLNQVDLWFKWKKIYIITP